MSHKLLIFQQLYFDNLTLLYAKKGLILEKSYYVKKSYSI